MSPGSILKEAFNGAHNKQMFFFDEVLVVMGNCRVELVMMLLRSRKKIVKCSGSPASQWIRRMGGAAGKPETPCINETQCESRCPGEVKWFRFHSNWKE